MACPGSDKSVCVFIVSVCMLILCVFIVIVYVCVYFCADRVCVYELIVSVFVSTRHDCVCV